MSIQSAGQRRRFMWSGFFALLVMFGMCAQGSDAQQNVSAGSVIPLNHTFTAGQIYRILQATDGTILFNDVSKGGLYQLSPGSETMQEISTQGSVLGTGYDNEGVTLDPNNTLYIGMRYGPSPPFFRVPYVNGTWTLTAGDAWSTNVGTPAQPAAAAAAISPQSSLNVLQVAYTKQNNLIVSSETAEDIYSYPVINNSDGTATLDQTNAVIVVTGLKAQAEIVSVDQAGNIFFSEEFTIARSKVAEGVYEIPYGTTGLVGDDSGALEKTLTRIDPPAAGNNYRGITFDAAGNMYLAQENDIADGQTSYGGIANEVYMVPNEGTLAAPKYVYADGLDIFPGAGTGNILVDSRGYLFVPNAGGNFQPNGDNVLPGTQGVVQYALGSVSVPVSPVGTTGTAGTIYYTFTNPETPGNTVLSQNGGGTNFVLSPTDPNAAPIAAGSTATPPLPCTAGTAYVATSYCSVWVSADPAVPGALSGEVVLQDATGNPLAGGTAYLSSIGEGAAASTYTLASSTSIASTLTNPRQVATDSLGNVYVADAGQAEVLMYPAGSAAASAGTPIGTGLKAPTGVAVDGSGDVYIGDSGNIYELPYQAGKLGAQTTIQAGLGNDLNLASDTFGNLFVADQDNARVVKVSNPQVLGPVTAARALTTIGSGFKAPSAVAVDATGNVYVADSGSLTEVGALATETAVTNSLAGTVTGLAVDASNSVLVSSATGVLRIPSQGGSLSVNNATALGGTTPPTSVTGVAVDPFGNAYITYTAGGAPLLSQLGVNGALNFGLVAVGLQTGPDSVQVFNTGTTGLTFTAPPTIAGTNGPDFSNGAAPNVPCDTTGANATAPGYYCYLGFNVDATVAYPPSESATATVVSNATNGAAPSISLIANGDNELTQSTTTITTTSSDNYTYPGAVTVTATVASANPAKNNTPPTGSATITLGGNAIPGVGAVTLVNGVATFNLTGLTGGTYKLNVVYGGDTNYLSSNGSATISIAAQTPTVTVGTVAAYVKANSVNTVTVTVVTPPGTTPTGSVVFLNGTSPADPAQASTTLSSTGQATFSTTALAPGSYTLTAVYSGDANFASVSSGPIQFQILGSQGDLLLTANPASLSLTPGVPATTQITATPLASFNSTAVTFYCDPATLPQYAECTFDFPTIGILGTIDTTTNLPTPGIVNVTVSTNVPVQSGTEARIRGDGLKSSPFVFAGLLGTGLLGLFVSRKSRTRVAGLLSMLMILMALGAGLSGCGGGYGQPPAAPHVTTPSGVYNVRIVAIATNITGQNIGDIPSNLGLQSALPFTLAVTVK